MNNYEIELTCLLEDILSNPTKDLDGKPIKYSKDSKTTETYIKILKTSREQIKAQTSESFTSKDLVLKIYDVLIDAFEKEMI